MEIGALLGFSFFQLLSIALVFLISGLVLSSYFQRRTQFARYKRLPPGPFCWPVIGYAPFFSVNTNYIHLKKAAQKYGQIFGFFIGNRYAVVVEDFEVLKQIFDRKFSARIPEIVQISTKPNPSVFDTNGELWEEHRKLWKDSLRLYGTSSDFFRSKLKELISDDLVKLKESTGEDVNLKEVFQHTINNVAFLMTYGKVFERDNDMVTSLSSYEQSVMNFIVFNTGKYFISFLGYVSHFIPLYRKSVQVITKVEKLISEEVDEHQLNLNVNDPRGLIDHLLIQMQENKNTVHNMSTLMGNVTRQLPAISEPIRITLMWFLLLMADHSEIQKEIQNMIDAVVGRERTPSLKDKSSLPLLEATIMETMRFRYIFHLNMFRSAGNDTTVCGYDIPKNTMLIYNMTAHFRNPKYWRNPDVFDPKRFLNEGGTSLRVTEHFIPFMFGRRSCLGEGLALSVLFMVCSSILQRFRVLPPKGGVNLDIKNVFANNPASPFARLQSRY